MDDRIIKVLLVLPFFYPHKGGSQKYAEEVHSKMMALDSRFKVDVLCYNTKRAPKLEEYRNFTVHRIPCWEIVKDKFLLPNPFSLLLKLISLSKNKYSFVETHVRFFDPTWWVWAYARLIGAKSVYVGHVPGHPMHQGWFIAAIGKFVDLTIAKFALKRYDYIFYANKACKNFYESVLGVKKAGIVAHIGINPEEFSSEERGETRVIPNTNVTLSTNKVLITYAGRMLETKGVFYLWEAILQLKEQLSEDVWNRLAFCFAGPGNLNEKLRGLIKEVGVEPNVLVLGELSYEGVRKLLAITNVFINPSSYDEGLPNTLLEAGASGCFVVTTGSGSISDLIVNGKTGSLVRKKNIDELADAIKWYLDNQVQAQTITDNLSIDIKNNYTWEETARIFIDNLN